MEGEEFKVGLETIVQGEGDRGLEPFRIALFI